MSGAGDDPKLAKIKELQRKADEIGAQMRDNIDEAVKRGMTLEEIEAKSRELEEQARKMRAGAAGVRQMYCRRNARLIALVVLIIAVIIIIIAVSASS